MLGDIIFVEGFWFYSDCLWAWGSGFEEDGLECNNLDSKR